MPRSVNRRSFVRLLTAALPLTASGCGTLFWGERKNRRHSGRIDPQVFLLDCAGLVLFGLGGLIALAMDFHNGTIYLPAGHASVGKKKSFFDRGHEKLVAIKVPKDQMTQANIERIASEHFGEPVSLAGRDVQRTEIRSTREFFPAARRLFRRRNLVG